MSRRAGREQARERGRHYERDHYYSFGFDSMCYADQAFFQGKDQQQAAVCVMAAGGDTADHSGIRAALSFAGRNR